MNVEITGFESRLTYKRLIMGAVAVLLAVISTTIAVFALQSPAKPLDFDTLKSAEDIKEEQVYVIEDLSCSGVFMYAGLSEDKGVPRQNGKGLFIDKEYVYAYHTLAVKEQSNGKMFLFVLSVCHDDGELFDTVAAHDRAENATGDRGSTFHTSVYVKAKKLGADARKACTGSKAEHQNEAGFENTEWASFEMEYVCFADEDYEAIASAERRRLLKLSFGILPLVALFLYLALRKERQRKETLELEEVPGTPPKDLLINTEPSTETEQSE